MPPRRKSVEEKFAENTRPEGDCIVWTGKRDRKGYGLISLERQRWSFAHRVMWKLKNGEWPDGLLMHSCDNPACVKLGHLSVGTYADNNHDAIKKGRMNNRGSRHGMSKISERDVETIRALYASGELTQAEIAQEFNIGQPMVSMICNRKNWRHLQ